MAHRARYMFAVSTSFLLGACTVGHQITHLPNTVSQGDQAAYYALPRTVVLVTFPVSKSEVKKGTAEAVGKSCFDRLGEAANFPQEGGGSARLEGFTKPMQLWEAIGLDKQPSTKVGFEITANPMVGSRAEPDPDQVFRVDLASSWAIKRQLTLAYGPLGVLESGTSFVQDRRVDLSLAFLKAVVDIGGEVASFGFKEDRAPAPRDKALNCKAQADPCHRAACEIFRAREGLYELPGRIEPDGLDAEQAAWLEKRYQEDIDKNMPLLVRQVTSKAEVVCAVRSPSVPPTSPFQVLQFEPAMGFEPGAGAECLVPHGFRIPGLGGTWTSYDLSITPSPVGNLYASKLSSAGVHNAHVRTEEQGFYYRVPAVALLEVRKGPEVLVRMEHVVAQLGFVAALPRQRTYQTNYKVTLDPATGALKTLESSSEALDPALISSSGTAIADALERRAKIEAEEAAATDELALLERERKILEERQKIRELQKKQEEEPPIP